MTTHAPVPSDVDADSILDLVQDCREVSGVLGDFVPTVLRLPESRSSDDVVSLEISEVVAAGLAGYEEYGS